MPAKSRSNRISKSSVKARDGSIKNSASASSPDLTTTEKLDHLDGQDAKANLFEKFIQPGAKLTPEEALASTHWLRQFIAIIVGTGFGIFRLMGFPPIVTFLVIAFTTPYSILSSMHDLDLEEIGTKGTIQTEGFFPATALFFLSWIISFTIFTPPAT